MADPRPKVCVNIYFSKRNAQTESGCSRSTDLKLCRDQGNAELGSLLGIR